MYVTFVYLYVIDICYGNTWIKMETSCFM